MARRGKDAQSDFFPGFDEVTEIGHGDLATVYRARELATDRFVALKLLNVRDRSQQVLQYFEREANALGPISSHPNIVTLFGSFRAADGRPVLVLELCRSAVADRLVDGTGLPVREVVAIGIKIAGALDTAHRAGILHRDVKPQNMLVTEFGEPALADFGVALLKSSTQVTAGLFDFTTLHAAPELLEGGETAPATDVYELASSLYQLIAGRSAFRANQGESPAAVILRILRDPVEPLVSAHVPDELSGLLLHAMAKDRGERPATAAEFAAQLAAIETAQGWPATHVVIRDVDGSRIDPAVALRTSAPVIAPPPVFSSAVPDDPDVTWAPPPDDAHREPSVAPPAAAEDVREEAADDWSTPSIVQHVEPVEPAREPANAPATAPEDSWSTPSIVTSYRQPDQPANQPDDDDDVNATRRRPTTLPPPPPAAPPATTPVAPPVTPTPGMPPPPVDVPTPEDDDIDATRRRPTTLPPPPPPAAPPPLLDMPAPDAATMNAHTGKRPLAQPGEQSAQVPSGYPPPLPPVADVPPPGWSPPPELTYDDLPANSLWVPPSPDGRPPVPDFGPNVEMPTATGPVPTWVFRAPSEQPGAGVNQAIGELTLDPASLRDRVTLRSGGASLVVDQDRILSRKWLSKTELQWRSVRGFETRLDQSGNGLLVVHTDSGPVELPATKGTSADLRYTQALLEAYRQRASFGR